MYRAILRGRITDFKIRIKPNLFFCGYCRKWFKRESMRNHLEKRHNVILIVPYRFEEPKNQQTSLDNF